MPRVRQSLRAEASRGKATCVQAVLTLREHKRLRLACVQLNQPLGDFARAAILKRLDEFEEDGKAPEWPPFPGEEIDE